VKELMMETPMLRQLMGAYFHQDWFDEHDDEWATVDDFLAHEPGAVRVADEIDHVLGRAQSELEVREFLRSLGSHYTLEDDTGSYRTWLTQLAAYARKALT
jgi:hypothetical protein